MTVFRPAERSADAPVSPFGGLEPALKAEKPLLEQLVAQTGQGHEIDAPMSPAALPRAREGRAIAQLQLGAVASQVAGDEMMIIGAFTSASPAIAPIDSR